MAYYAALSSLSQTLEQIPQPHVDEQITSLLSSLHDKVSGLLTILGAFPQKSSSLTQDLEGEIRDASYKAEDIIESHISRSQDMITAVHLCERSAESTDQDINMEFEDLEQIIDDFESILNDLSDYEINDGEEDLSPGGEEDLSPGEEEDLPPGEEEDLEPRNSPTAGSSRFPASNESTPVGLRKDLSEIQYRLTGSTSKLEIITILGIGGIGKTTLARSAYDDPIMNRHFDVRAWIVVSREYHVQEMVTSLLNSTRPDGGELHQKNIQQLSTVLYKTLKDRKYLIVMDDVWDTKAWDQVKSFFPDDNNGSRIILTTRLPEVANYARASSPIHRMSLLSSEASWNLLREKVFGKNPCPFGLKKIGKEIAENCKGLPLAIILIGGILSTGSRTRNYWEHIARNVELAVTGNDDLFKQILFGDDHQFMQILLMSYNFLPHYLKSCFLYMGVFPEDYEIFASKLIKLWIAEGFVKPLTPKSLEEVAENYLEDLIHRNFVMVHTRNRNGRIKTCIMHDSLRDLCLKKAQEDKFLQIMKDKQGSSSERRVSIQSDILYHFMNVHDSSIRSLIYFCKRYSNYKLLSFTMSCRLLKVFDALTIRFYEFPIEIVELVHLRYLAFLYGGNNFPASISKLQNLQTIIALSLQPVYLPPNILEMPQLRHIVFEESFLPEQIIWTNSLVLENLQTLSGITNFRCTKKVFKLMPNLKKLGISYIHDVDTKWSSYEFNNFVYLCQLEKLKCLFIAKRLRVNRSLPINLAFPPNLKRLTLSGCRISWEKMTIIGSVANLEVLKLKDHAFEGSEWELKEGEFSALKFLLIHTSFLEYWNVNGSPFPKLQHLSLSCCPKLAGIPSEIGDIATLEMLELYECNPSAVESTMPIQDARNNNLRIRVISYKRVYDSQQQNTSLQSWATKFSLNRQIESESEPQPSTQKQPLEVPERDPQARTPKQPLEPERDSQASTQKQPLEPERDPQASTQKQPLELEPDPQASTQKQPFEQTNTTKLGSNFDERDWRAYDGRDSLEDDEWDWRVYDGRDSDEDDETEIEDSEFNFDDEDNVLFDHFVDSKEERVGNNDHIELGNEEERDEVVRQCDNIEINNEVGNEINNEVNIALDNEVELNSGVELDGER